MYHPFYYYFTMHFNPPPLIFSHSTSTSFSKTSTKRPYHSKNKKSAKS